MNYIAQTKNFKHLIELDAEEFNEFKHLADSAGLCDDYVEMTDGNMLPALRAANKLARSLKDVRKLKKTILEIEEALTAGETADDLPITYPVPPPKLQKGDPMTDPGDENLIAQF